MNEYNKQRVKKLLQYILACAGQEENFYARALSRIHLIKYVYLADLAYARRHDGQTYTGLPWRFYKFGPWCEELLWEIEPALNEIGAEQMKFSHPKYEDDFIKWRLSDDELCARLDDDLDVAVTGIIQRAVRDFGSDTTSLLHHTYNTKPMLTAAPNESIDFNTVALSQEKPEEEGSDSGVEKRQLTDRQKKKRQARIKAFKEQMHQKSRPEKKRITPEEPRYDTVFEEGMAWLDSLAGEPPKPTEGELIISPDAWRSRARFDPESIDDDIS